MLLRLRAVSVLLATPSRFRRSPEGALPHLFHVVCHPQPDCRTLTSTLGRPITDHSPPSRTIPTRSHSPSSVLLATRQSDIEEKRDRSQPRPWPRGTEHLKSSLCYLYNTRLRKTYTFFVQVGKLAADSSLFGQNKYLSLHQQFRRLHMIIAFANMASIGISTIHIWLTLQSCHQCL